MPSDKARRYEIAFYVEPEHVEEFERILETEQERDSLTLQCEKLAGALMAGEPMSDSDYGYAPYGFGVVECYPEGGS